MPDVVGERGYLTGLAFRMLGTIADAEDAVQETYIRWYRQSDPERASIESARAWLTRVIGRICLDMLTSARARRERYVGPWLPEPVPLHAFAPDMGDWPAERVALDDTVSTALLVLLESMTPAERVAFVLHDVFGVPFTEIGEIVGRSPAACRQLAVSARTRVRRSPARTVSRAEHDRVVRAFARAARSGDMAALIATLDPDVVARSDGGGRVSAARNPIHGADRVARYLTGALRTIPSVRLADRQTNDGLGFVLQAEDSVVGLVTLEVDGGVVTQVRLVLNPDKLTLWR